MASYVELHGIRNNGDLNRKVHVAIADVAYDILLLSPADTELRLAWAKEAIAAPASKTSEMISYILIENKGAAVAAILTASDASVKTNISTAVDVIVGPAA